MDNPFFESFNRRRRAEHLNTELCVSAPDVLNNMLEWQQDYNETGLHGSRGRTFSLDGSWSSSGETRTQSMISLSGVQESGSGSG